MINVLFARKIFVQNCYFISSHFVLFSFLDDHPAEATFRGNEYIAYDLQQRGVEPILSTNDEISLYFKTRKSSGLLFYTGNFRYVEFINKSNKVLDKPLHVLFIIRYLNDK